MPKVSVIIPVYGVEKYIERCARSLFEQTLDDIEYIFVDDCSKDNSIEILQKVLKDYPTRQQQVRVLFHNENRGLPAARQSGIAVASGDYIIHCDSDDWVNLDMYQLMYEKAQEKSADVVVCDYAKINGKISQTIKGCRNTEHERFLRDMFSMKVSWSLCNKLIRRDLIKKPLVFPKKNMGEDMALVLQVLSNDCIVTYIPQALYNYYTNPMSISQVQSIDVILGKYKQVLENTEIVSSYYQKIGLAEKYKDSLQLLKWNVRKQLWGIVHIPQYRKIWFEAYPELDYSLCFNSELSITEKLKYLLTLLHMYPRKRDRVSVNK